jgi:DNA-directed RNA polymerase
VLKRKEELTKAEKRSLSARRENAYRASRQAVHVANDDFYFRVGMDFRGRIYYKSAHLNPQMGDDVKAILMLADKKPLGESGFKWLMWGIASAAGFDKADFQTRVKWSIDRMPQIEQSVKDPINSELFASVLSSGEPALYLQRATELVNALNSGSIFTYETNIAIAMDATCSGLQLLSAVSKDADGGSLVNITATQDGQTEKNDVYGKVAQMLIEKYSSNKDAFSKWIATNGVPRRLTKKPVMTLPYSATERSAASYIKEELQGDPEKGIAPYPLPDTTEERKQILTAIEAMLYTTSDKHIKMDTSADAMYYNMARLLAKDTHELCYRLLPAAMRLLDFFKDTPRHLADHAIWHTPDGLRVKQKYGKKVTMQTQYTYDAHQVDPITGEIVTRPLKVRRKYEYTDQHSKNAQKSSNGMPPNWVHSLDAALVRRTILKCKFPIICIHDSFAAHPADCERLAQVLREEFVWLIEQDPLGSLCKELNEQAGACVFNKDVLMVNTWNPEDALRSEFLFC